MNQIWSLTLEDIAEIIDIGHEIGLKPGDKLDEAIYEWAKRKNVKPIGNTELTKDEFIKEQISHNKKVGIIKKIEKGDSNV